MAIDMATTRQLRGLLDPLREGGILAEEQCDELLRLVTQFLDVIRAEGMPTDERYWGKFQQQFDFACDPRGVTPMNAANLCPEPRALLEAANLLRLQYNRNVAQQTRMARGQRAAQIAAARELLAAGLHAGLTPGYPADSLAIVRNASEGNNAISCGYRKWRRTGNPDERENVVLWAENHPTNLIAWHLRAEWESPQLFKVEPVKFEYNQSDDAIAGEFINKIGPLTRFVSFSETANGSGFRIPEPVIHKIWKHIEERKLNCHVHIDATMAWGARPMEGILPFCHSLVSSGHKWYLGPKGTGILWMREDKVENFAPSIFGYDYKIEIPPKWENMSQTALRFELLGQRDDVNIITLAWTQMMWNELAERRQPYQRVSELAQSLMKQLKESDWAIITPQDATRSWGVVRVRAPRGSRTKSLYEWLYDERRIAGSGGGSGDNETFRLCPHLYNTFADLKRAVEGMNDWRRG